ncbi:Methicillin resistance mecR1 protein [Planctomycetes bacterium CA13]|uniref:Methicillin resistance mecR1 protein n=1 Tax=Novipirellula herctigrandis TaxID=2527986 RepID=A0A5C5Z8C7_9BACT|nr:Methicillin resistance mecR1 protein [Planctomycetes bacterium CA13]
MIHATNDLAGDWFKWLVSSSWQVGLFVVLVACLCLVLKKGSPRLRHGLWLLALLKMFLPPSLSVVTGIGHWLMPDIAAREAGATVMLGAVMTGIPQTAADLHNMQMPQGLSGAAQWMLIWSIGVLAFFVFVLLRYRKATEAMRSNISIDEGPLRIALEKSAIKLGLLHLPDLYVTDTITSPLLFGILRPSIVLPRTLTSTASETELMAALSHELTHFRRRDVWVGWLQIVAQGLFWFHPLVWWANRRIRDSREECCDEAVLSDAGVTPAHYGEAMMRVLTSSKAKSLAGATFLGVFERGTNLQNRLEQIMNYETKRSFGWASKALLLVVATVLLPMAPGATGRLGAEDVAATNKASTGQAPKLVTSTPAIGQTDVKVSLDEIRVTFDRDMGKGMSWTGGPPLFPPVDKSRKAQWIDRRTCALPVKFERGKFYRLGINARSFQNFRSSDGVPVEPIDFYFVTEDASKDVLAMAEKPKVVELSPANDGTDVDPKTRSVSVTFNIPMSAGMSWTGGGANFPTIPAGRSAKWSKDRKTCTLPVELAPKRKYRLGLNSKSFRNFQSEHGISLDPVVYEFETK